MQRDHSLALAACGVSVSLLYTLAPSFLAHLLCLQTGIIDSFDGRLLENTAVCYGFGELYIFVHCR